MADAPAAVSGNTGRSTGLRPPWQPGQSGNPNGRPKKDKALRDILRGRPMKDKRALVQIAYDKALEGDVHWAEWIAKHSGESGSTDRDENGGLMRELIIREYGGWPEQLQ